MPLLLEKRKMFSDVTALPTIHVLGVFEKYEEFLYFYPGRELLNSLPYN